MKEVMLIILRLTTLVGYIAGCIILFSGALSPKIPDRALILTVGMLVFVVLGELLDIKERMQ